MGAARGIEKRKRLATSIARANAAWQETMGRLAKATAVVAKLYRELDRLHRRLAKLEAGR